jgi:hypothetical protein
MPEIMDELRKISDMLQKACRDILSCKAEINSLKDQVNDRDRRIRELEVKVNILEQRNRKNNVVITDVDLRSFAEVAGAVTLPDQSEDGPVPRGPAFSSDNKKEGLIAFSKEVLRHEIDPDTVIDCFQLKDKKVLVKFSSAKAKLAMMAARRKIAIRNHYINDQMTYEGGQLAKRCRELRKKNKIKFTWTRLGKIFVKKDEESNVIEIQRGEEITKFLNG